MGLEYIAVLDYRLDYGVLGRLIMSIILGRISNTTARTAARSATADGAVLLNGVIRRIRLLTTCLMFLTRAIIDLVRLLACDLMIALLGDVTSYRCTIFLTRCRIDTTMVLFTCLDTGLFRLLPYTVTRDLRLDL